MLSLAQRHVQEMVAHAREEAPNECCGVLAGKDSTVHKLYRLSNTEREPHRYTTDPRGLYNSVKDARSQGWEVLAFYHSHPHGPPCPSDTDVRLSDWLGVFYLVVSLQDPANPVVQAFYIEDWVITQVPYTVFLTG